MTNSELVLLSLLAEHPRHGYELEQVIEECGMHNWSEIAFSSIYFLLKRLVLEGMATSSTQSRRRVVARQKRSTLPLQRGWPICAGSL